MTDQPSFEELAAPRPNRFGPALAILLALLVGIVVVIRIADSGSSNEPAAAPQSTAIAPPTVKPVPLTPAPSRFVITTRFRNAPRCPRATDGHVACTSYPGLAAPTERALRERFPQIVVEHAVTRMLRRSNAASQPQLWSRAITGRVGAVEMRIAVRRADSQDGVTTAMQLGKRIQLIRFFRGPYLVDFEMRGPVDPHSLSPTIAWLLTEPRLVRPALAARGTMMR